MDNKSKAKIVFPTLIVVCVLSGIFFGYFISFPYDVLVALLFGSACGYTASKIKSHFMEKDGK